MKNFRVDLKQRKKNKLQQSESNIKVKVQIKAVI